MSKYQVDFGVNVKTKLDESGVSKLLSSLNTVQKEANLKLRINDEQIQQDLRKTIDTVGNLKRLLTESFDADLGMLSINKFNTALNKEGMTIKEISKDLNHMGASGKKAFDDLAHQALSVNTGVRQTSEFLSKMATTMANTARWGVTASIFQAITSEVSKAYQYIVDLDTSLNDIRIVTGKSSDEMVSFAKEANKAAQALNTTTTEYTNAALIYYQQGLSEEEVKTRTDITVKAANVTGQAAEDTSNQLTAVWNGYKVQSDELESYVDKLAAVAASSAADMEELATATSKVASVAANTGVDFDQLTSMIATTVSVTKQAPEAVGVAYKTIFARLGDLKISGVDEEGVKVGEV